MSISEPKRSKSITFVKILGKSLSDSEKSEKDCGVDRMKIRALICAVYSASWKRFSACRVTGTRATRPCMKIHNADWLQEQVLRSRISMSIPASPSQ